MRSLYILKTDGGCPECPMGEGCYGRKGYRPWLPKCLQGIVDDKRGDKRRPSMAILHRWSVNVVVLVAAMLMVAGSWEVVKAQEDDAAEDITAEDAEEFEALGASTKADDFTCFEIGGVVPKDNDVTLFHQFKEKGHYAEVRKPRFLCAPTKKVHYKDDGHVDFEGPHLKCFNIKSDWEPKNTHVTLTTQFGKEKHKVGDAKLLCAVAKKKVDKKDKED